MFMQDTGYWSRTTDKTLGKQLSKITAVFQCNGIDSTGEQSTLAHQFSYWERCVADNLLLYVGVFLIKNIPSTQQKVTLSDFHFHFLTAWKVLCSPVADKTRSLNCKRTTFRLLQKQWDIEVHELEQLRDLLQPAVFLNFLRAPIVPEDSRL